ncbi:MAG: hypothetical protein RIR31_1372 [Bacteroidota bacterium]|jgi:hypothetical protein
MKIILLFFIFFTVSAYSQSADFIMLKKKNKTIQAIYAGSNIAFTTVSGSNINAHINGIKNDTLLLQEYITQYLPTTIGTYIVDTVGSYRYKFHYNQIKLIGKTHKKGFNTKGSGASLFGGGVLLTLASGVVFLVDRDKFSAPLLITSAALATAGYFMAKGGSSGLLIGKKYKLVYMDMSNKKR